MTADSLGAWSFSNLLPGAYFALQVPPTTASGSSVDYRATGPLTQSALNTVVAACNTATSSSDAAYVQCTPIAQPGGTPKQTYLRIVFSGAAAVSLPNLPFLSQSGDLTIAITDGVASVVAGTDTTYTVTVSNVGGGTAPATTSTTTVTMPTGVTYNRTSGNAFTCTWATPTLTCVNQNSIPVGTDASFDVEVHVATDFSGASLVMNAQTGAPAYDFNTTNDCTASNGSCYNTVQTGVDGSGLPVYSNVPIYPDTDTVTRTAPLTITSSAAGVWAANPTGFAAGEVVAGTSLQTTITITNAGPSAAATTLTTDFLESDTDWTGGTYCVETSPATCLTAGGTWSPIPAPSGRATTVEIYSGTIAGQVPVGQVPSGGTNWRNGVSQLVYLRADVKSSAPQGGTIAGSQTLATSTTGATITGSPSAASLSVIRRSDIQLALSSSPATVLAGNSITYSVTVTNAGPSDAEGVAVASALGSPLTGGRYCSGAACTFSGSSPTWSSPLSIGPLAAAASSSFKVSAPVPSSALKASTITTAFTASASTVDWSADTTPADGVSDNATASTDTAVDTRADLSVAVTAPSPAIAGTTVTYTVTISNAGPSDALGVELASLDLDARLTSPTACIGSGCDATAGSSLADVLAGLTGAPLPAQITTTDATLKPTGQTPSTWVLRVAGTLASSILKNATVPVAASATTTTQDDTASNDSASASATVDTRSDLSVAVTTRAGLAGDPVGRAFGAGEDGGSPASFVVAGQWATYDVTVTNAGPSDDVGFTLRRPKTSFDAQDYVTMEFCVLAADDSCAGGYTSVASSTLAGSANYDVTGIALPAGTAKTIRVRFDVRSAAGINGPGRGTPASTLANTLWALTGSTADAVSANDAATVTSRIKRFTDLTTTVTSAASVNAGSTIRYTVVVSNAGPSDDTDGLARVTPPNASWIGTAKSCVVSVGGSTCTPNATVSGATNVSIGSIADGTSRTVLVDVPVLSATTDGTTLPLSATAFTATPIDTVHPDNRDPNQDAGDTDDASSLVTTLSDLVVAVSAPKTLVGLLPSSNVDGDLVAGTTMEYRVVVTNDGPSDTTAASVTTSLADAANYRQLKVCVIAVGQACTSAGAFADFTSGSTVAVGAIADGASATVVVRADLGSWTAATTPISGTSTIASSASDADDADGPGATDVVDPIDPTNPTVTGGANVKTSADVRVAMSSVPVSDASTVIRIGETMTYTITVTNDGPSYARSVVLKDLFDTRLGSLQVTGGNGCSFAGQLLTCALGDLTDVASRSADPAFLPIGEPPSSYTITVSGVVGARPGFTDDGWLNDRLDNTARVNDPSATTTDPQSANDSATTTSLNLQRRFTSFGSWTGSTAADYSDWFDFKVQLFGDRPDVNGNHLVDDGVAAIQGASVSFALDCPLATAPLPVVTDLDGTDANGWAEARMRLMDVPNDPNCTVRYWWEGDETFFQTYYPSTIVPSAPVYGGSGSLSRPGVSVMKETGASISNGEPFWEIPLSTSMKTVQATTQRVTLQAVVTENPDGTLGDITKSQVVFELYKGSNLSLATPDFYCNPASFTPTTYVAGATPPWKAPAADGRVSCQVDLTEDTWTVIVKFLGTNGYYTGPASEPYVVTVFVPTLDYYTAGGGWYSIPTSSWRGVVPLGPTQNRAFFGFSVKFANLQRTTPSGRVLFQFRGADGFAYQMKMTSWVGGALTFTRVNASQFKATFGGKCILNKIDPRSGTVVFTYSNGTCRFDVTDNATTADTMAVTMLTTTNSVVFASGTLQSQIPITGGGIRVKMPLK
ncbi:MAG: hypothetical protein ACKOKE_06955 [Actinomycetota bacterium]